MKLVEIIKGKRTYPETVERARELCAQLGKTPVIVRESPGFVVNRLLCPMLNEAAYLLMENVASAEDIAVSYTHLDVYKRQAQGSVGRMVGRFSG